MFRRPAFAILALPIVSVCLVAQGIQPYPNAVTDRLFYAKTPMAPPAVNVVFQDPDFGSSIVRVTDGNTDPKRPNGFFRNPPGDVNVWSADNRKFYVAGSGAKNFAFAFDPSTMKVSPLPGAGAGGALQIPLRQGPTFSFRDPDLLYGTALKAPLKITTYRFSTGKTETLFDTTQCGTQPPLVAGPTQSSNDSVLSNDDNRIAISAGANSFGKRPFVIIYDKQLGCRWYNTQTGQIGGQWGPIGYASTLDRYSINHVKFSGNGQYAKISAVKVGYYVWDVQTLNVQYCNIKTGPHCDDYQAVGYNSVLNAPGVKDELNVFLRPLSDITRLTQLINPLPTPYYQGMEKAWAWTNGALHGMVPACGSTYSTRGHPEVKQPYDGEVFCIETDGVAPTIWRFAHNRSIWDPDYYWTQPYANISLDGRFFAFTSGWDGQVGTTPDGDPRTDVWIVRLD